LKYALHAIDIKLILRRKPNRNKIKEG